MINIFNEAKESSAPEWAKFTNNGDSVQGTYVGKLINVKDGYGNDQIVYQLLQDDGRIINVGFGMNKKMIHSGMEMVRFGQIIGFMYKGKISVKDKFNKPVEVKDIGLFQDPKIVDTKWLMDHKDDMPVSIDMASTQMSAPKEDNSFDKIVSELQSGSNNTNDNDVPFSSEGSETNDDKLAKITRLAKEKFGVTSAEEAKNVIMEKTSIAFIPINYDKIIEALNDIF
jgi:hypothetical protein